MKEAKQIEHLESKLRLERQRAKLRELVNWTPGNSNKNKSLRRAVVKALLPKYKSTSQASQNLGLRRHFIKKIALTPEEELLVETKPVKIGKEVQQSVADYYMSPDISISLGGMRAANKKGEAVRYLNVQLKEVYRKWRAKFVGRLAFSTFAKLRPKKTIKLKRQIPMNECLCLCGPPRADPDSIKEVVSKSSSCIKGKYCNTVP